MVLATIVGGLTLVALLGTMCSNARKRGKAWTTLSGYVLGVVLQLTGIILLILLILLISFRDKHVCTSW